MPGGFIWTSMDPTIFYSKRNKAVEKVLSLSGILVTAQHRLNMGYDVIRLLTLYLLTSNYASFWL